MPRTKRVSDIARANEGHFCTVSGCTEHRTSISQFCVRHRSAIHRNGHPTAPAVRVSNWAPYRKKVREVYQTNSAHEGLTRALQLLDAWMLNATCLANSKPWAAEIDRVKRHGCSALDVLVELAAVWCFLQDNPRATQSDSHRDFTISQAVLGLAPRPRTVTAAAAMRGASGYTPKAKPAALRHIGPELRRMFGPLLVTTHQSLQTEAERARVEIAAFRIPFQPTTTALQQAAAGQGISS